MPPPQDQVQQQHAMQRQMMQEGTSFAVATATGEPRKREKRGSYGRSSSSSHKHNMSSEHNMSSLHSFGFEAIEEDDITEASYKMSNLGLSEMDMTLGSDVLSG